MIRFKSYNRYYIVGVVFFIWVFFLDTNNLLTHHKINKKIKDLDNAKKFYQDEIKLL